MDKFLSGPPSAPTKSRASNPKKAPCTGRKAREAPPSAPRKSPRDSPLVLAAEAETRSALAATSRMCGHSGLAVAGELAVSQCLLFGGVCASPPLPPRLPHNPRSTHAAHY